ncbi:hypothetical protein ACS0PU_013011 [Formica fusca]
MYDQEKKKSRDDMYSRQNTNSSADLAAVRLRFQITLGTSRIVITRTSLILSVRIKEEKAIKVSMPPF